MKKTFIYSFCAVFVLIAIIASLVFVFSGNEKTSTEILNMSGTWIVSSFYDNDNPTFTENQFIVFSDADAVFYKDDLNNPYITSKYTIDEGKLVLSDISKEYKLDVKTDNCVRLYEDSTKYMLLIKKENPDISISLCTAESMNGKWDIKMKGDQYNNGEVLEFEEDSMRYYKNISEEPIADSKFEISDNNTLYAQDLKISMKCYSVSENTVIFIEETSGIVWELSKTEN